MSADLIKLAHRYYDALNAIDLETVATMFVEDAEYHSSGVGSLRGKAQILAAMRKYFTEYADQVATVESSELLDGRIVRSTWRLNATSGITGKPLIRKGIEILTFNDRDLLCRVDVEDR